MTGDTKALRRFARTDATVLRDGGTLRVAAAALDALHEKPFPEIPNQIKE